VAANPGCRRAFSPMPQAFRPPRLRINWWGGPPGPRGTPSSRPCLKNQSAATAEKPTRGSAADEGVRPTICATARKREKHAALAFRPPSSTGDEFFGLSQRRPAGTSSRKSRAQAFPKADTSATSRSSERPEGPKSNGAWTSISYGTVVAKLYNAGGNP